MNIQSVLEHELDIDIFINREAPAIYFILFVPSI